MNYNIKNSNFIIKEHKIGEFSKAAFDFVLENNIDKNNLKYEFTISRGRYLDLLFYKITKSHKYSDKRKDMIYNYCIDQSFLELFFTPFCEELPEKIFNFLKDYNISDEKIDFFIQFLLNNKLLELISNEHKYDGNLEMMLEQVDFNINLLISKNYI